MTSYGEASARCAVCGAVSTQTVLRSTNTFGGGPDLDLRPGEMKRSTMNVWVQQCPRCGYCNTELSEATPAAKPVVESAAYRSSSADVTYPALARRFLCASMVSEAEGELGAAAQQSLCAAWACDDADHPDAATACRRRAAELFRRQDRDDPGHEKDRAGLSAVLADVLRRAGDFEGATRELTKGLARQPDDTVAAVLRFQKALVDRRDVSRHLVSEALREFAPHPLDKPVASRPSQLPRTPSDDALRAARRLWERVESGGWQCTHCGREGTAGQGFRLSLGERPVVICRRCGWPQNA